MTSAADILKLLEHCPVADQRQVFDWLREQHQIHPLEAELGAKAEVILEAISRASDLSKRGVRGLIAEATFKVEVLSRLSDWTDTTPPGDHPYDFQISKDGCVVKIQVKLQRRSQGRPMMANEASRSLHGDYFVVETQKTRGGKKGKEGEATRPYRFGEFDILAVSMQVSSGNWAHFRYTVANWLLPRADNRLLQVFQPIPSTPNDDWTDDLETCVAWLKEGKQKRISGLREA